ncbi:hypothetical protein GWI33_021570 [Rhynchophorus ferrugineus]|uniref:Uncharacterized protein n=1 Tax=Rhynchophorus ferrugineus TaxID=354439 RepID=A0A834IVR9_RHYFE|nr:hypothetical protein GWI33_021570 [Rhynchophorus ferrugineus]
MEVGGGGEERGPVPDGVSEGSGSYGGEVELRPLYSQGQRCLCSKTCYARSTCQHCVVRSPREKKRWWGKIRITLTC